MTKLNSLSTIVLTAAASTGCVSTSRQVASATAIYAFESDGNGFNTKNFFYDNGEEVVVFDTQFTGELAQRSVDFIRTKTMHPITHVVITHPNPDKFNGMSVFQTLGGKVIASRSTAAAMPGVHAYKQYYFVNMAKMFSAESYPKLASVDTTFEGSFDLKLRNGEVIQLRELSAPGVSSTQTVAYIPSQNALVVGDLVHNKAHAWLEGGIVDGKPTPTLQGWVADLEALERDYPADARVLGGRGQEAALNQAIPEQIRYLQKTDALTTAHVRKFGEKANSPEATASLTKDFEAAFPDYALSYMITYGVYGLVQSKVVR